VDNSQESSLSVDCCSCILSSHEVGDADTIMMVRSRKRIGASKEMLQSQPQRGDPIKEIGGVTLHVDSPVSSTMLVCRNTRDSLRS